MSKTSQRALSAKQKRQCHDPKYKPSELELAKQRDLAEHEKTMRRAVSSVWSPTVFR